MMLVVDKEGKRIPAGDEEELKTMGSDIRLSSTPEAIRVMLKELVIKLLNAPTITISPLMNSPTLAKSVLL